MARPGTNDQRGMHSPEFQRLAVKGIDSRNERELTTIREVRAAARKVRTKQVELNDARADLAGSIEAAQHCGTTLTAIAESLGISRQSVYSLIERWAPKN